MEANEILSFAKWGFGFCVIGFFTLAGWMFVISREMVTSKQILSELQQIKLGLFGDMERPGIVAQVHNHTKDIKEIKENCKEVQDKKDPLHYAHKMHNV